MSDGDPETKVHWTWLLLQGLPVTRSAPEVSAFVIPKRGLLGNHQEFGKDILANESSELFDIIMACDC